MVAAWVLTRTRATTEELSGSFCEIYPQVSELTAMLERGLEGRGGADDLAPSDYLAIAELVWSDRVAEGGPVELERDAVRIATAVRTAATTGDSATLKDPAVQRAIDRVEPAARDACEARER